MINLNFLGLGSLTAKQQKGKTNGVMSAEPESGSALPAADSGITEAAFPNVLMQLLLGQQIPAAIPAKIGQSPISTETTIDGEILASEKPSFIGGQQLSLREQLFANEIKKQSAVQKGEMNTTVTAESAIVLDLSENMVISSLLPKELNAEAENLPTNAPLENGESLPLTPTAKSIVEGMNINPLQVPSSTVQPTSGLMIEEKDDKPSVAGKQTEKIAVKANSEKNGLNIPVPASPGLSNNTISHLIPQTSSLQNNATQNSAATAIKQNVESNEVSHPISTSDKTIVDNSKSVINNLFANEIMQPNTITKESILAKQILPSDSQPLENKTANSESDSTISADSLKASLQDSLPVLRQSSSVRKQTANKILGKEQYLTSISSNDLQQKGILSAVVTQNEKSPKNIYRESIASDKTIDSENKSLTAASVEIDEPVNGVKSEAQHSGNSTFTAKDNFDRQVSAGKDIASIDGRQGQQSFASIVEEKGSGIISKAQQPELSSLLQRQETVNTIVEQLAKNVTVSLDENNSQMKISLKPEALGEVLLKVSIEQGKVSTQMEVQQPQVKAVIEANLQVLRESLTSKGLVVERIDISTAQYSLNERSSQHGQQRSNLKNYFGKEIDDDITEQTKLFGYNTVDYVA